MLLIKRAYIILRTFKSQSKYICLNSQENIIRTICTKAIKHQLPLAAFSMTRQDEES